MSGQDWLTPATAPPPSPYEQLTSNPGPRAAGHELRPLTLSEILDRTFSVFRSRFWLFCGIASIGGMVLLLTQIAQLTVQHVARKGGGQEKALIASVLISIVVLFVAFLVYGILQAATVYALTAVYLGRAVTIGESMKAAFKRWLTYILISIWQYFSFCWLPLVLMIPAFVLIVVFAGSTTSAVTGGLIILLAILAGLPVGVILGIRNMLAIPAALDENRRIRASMRRSKDLAKGAKGRIFVVLLIWGALYMVVGMLEMPLAIVAGIAIQKGGEAIGSQAILLLINFIGHSVVFPVGLIGLTLIYFDQRVRKEAYDLELLIGETPAPAPVVAAPPVYEWAAPVTYAPPAPPVVEPEPLEPESPNERSL